jgi:hypothetical protein
MPAIRTDIEEGRKKLDPAYPFIHGVEDAAKPVELPLAIRGNPENLGPEVPRHFLSILSPGEPQLFSKGSGRLELAEDILKQPIAMRVIVNRIWKGHFGTGIVDSPSNFGTTDERPTNPDLLEYLANSFVKNGLSIKKLHREIMLSSVYQLSSDLDETNAAKDSGNRSYWRFDRKRLEAEQLRDAVLLISGNLDKSLGGPSTDLTPAFTRRSVYGKVSRYKLDEYLQLFDFPAPNISAENDSPPPSSAAPLPHEQRFHAGRGSNLRQARGRRTGQPLAHQEGVHAVYGRDPSEQKSNRESSTLPPSRCSILKKTKTSPPKARPAADRAAGVAVSAQLPR